MVSANSRYGDGNASVTITDTAGLTWVPLAETHYPAYAGVWAALVQAPAAGVFAFVPGAAEPGAATPGCPARPAPSPSRASTARITVTAVPGTVTGGGGGGVTVDRGHREGHRHRRARHGAGSAVRDRLPVGARIRPARRRHPRRPR